MYGISNSQQPAQGGGSSGGGGGAASYKAIKSSIAPSDWQEIPTRSLPFFVGSNVMEWAETNGIKTKSQSTTIGLLDETDYTITIVVDGQTYTETATASEYGGMVDLQFSITNDITVVIYDGVDVSTFEPGTSSMCGVVGIATTTTSFVITKFEGGDFGTIIQATIADTAIKVNSAVTMYTNTSYKISEGEKTDGSVILTAPSIPETDISYTLEIVGTDTEGLFKLVLSDYDDLSNIPVINQDLSDIEFTPVKDMYYRHTGATDSDYTNGSIYKCVGRNSTSGRIEMYEIATMREFNELRALLPREKVVSNGSTKVSITGDASPYLFTIKDYLVNSNKFVRVYPGDEDTEIWLNEHTLSSIITEETAKFTFKVDTATLPGAFRIIYVVQDLL